MRVSGPVKPGAARGGAKTKSSPPVSGGFQVAQAEAQSGAGAAAAADAPVETLSALIDLQSDGGASRGKLIAAGMRALSLLDRIQQGLLDGRIHVRDLDALAQDAAEASAQFSAGRSAADADLAALYNDIALRARVELAKLGR